LKETDMMNRTAFATALAVTLTLPGFAADTPLLPATPPTQILPAPPADGSAAQKRELREIRAAQVSMTKAAFAQALADEKTEDATIFNAAVGIDLKTLPKTWALMATVRAEEKVAAKASKNYFLRNRPWVIDGKLKTCTREDAPQSSYPSGHSTMGFSMAVVLAAMVPEKAAAILGRARDYAENRIVCGVHYRSDIIGGQALGTGVAEELLTNARFAAELTPARSELRAALKLAD
jgi:acid phosphatase (class A)